MPALFRQGAFLACSFMIMQPVMRPLSLRLGHVGARAIWYSYVMRTVLFVPGFQEDSDTRNYKATVQAIKKRGYNVRFVPITWKRTVLDDWVKELEEVYAEYDPNSTILAGFSYGSLISLVAATKRAPCELWLFSLSPYFSDDIPKMAKPWLKHIGKRRAERFKRLHFDAQTVAPSVKITLWVGEKEAQKYPLVARRTKIAGEAWENTRVILVQGADHDVADKNYIAAIADNI